MRGVEEPVPSVAEGPPGMLVGVPGFLTSQLPETTTYATLCNERRTNLINAPTLNRKSGGAQWRACPERSRMGACRSKPPPHQALTDGRTANWGTSRPASVNRILRNSP
jgi:hypothetical protein